MRQDTEYDVTIMGGGLAGLALSIQLSRTYPSLRLLVLERRKHPAPAAAFKVGESTIEAGARYYAQVLGLEDYLLAEHYVKPGLIFYFSALDNSDVTRRIEFGQSQYPSQRAYQLDRGRLETHMGKVARGYGVEFIDDCRVTDVKIDGAAGHSVIMASGDTKRAVSTRWVVDASGRSSILKRKLQLNKEIDHQPNAAWFRVGAKISIEDFSNDAEWTNRIEKPGTRWFSTNHLMGKGYWVWLIPLAPGNTSVGIVAEDAFHPLSTYNSLDKALEWLSKHEPQVYQHVAPHKDNVLDFIAMKHYAHDCQQLFSRDRWAICGEAGCFLDPFYSTGSDLIALANTLTTKMIGENMKGKFDEALATKCNSIFKDMVFSPLHKTYHNQYPVMGNPQVFTAKLLWDALWYWAVFGLLYYQDKLLDFEFLDSIAEDYNRSLVLEYRMQQLILDWDKLENKAWTDIFIDQNQMYHTDVMESALTDQLTPQQLRARITFNVDLLEDLAKEMFLKAAKNLPVPLQTVNINPYAISLSPERWEEDGLYNPPPKRSRPEDDMGAERINMIHEDVKYIWFDLRERDSRTMKRDSMTVAPSRIVWPSTETSELRAMPSLSLEQAMSNPMAAMGNPMRESAHSGNAQSASSESLDGGGAMMNGRSSMSEDSP